MATAKKKTEAAEAEEAIEETKEVENTTEETANGDPMEELVDFYRPPLPYEGASQQINLTLNGVTMSYVRGNHVQMPRKYVAMVENGEKEQMDAVMTRQKLQEEYEKNRAAMS